MPRPLKATLACILLLPVVLTGCGPQPVLPRSQAPPPSPTFQPPPLPPPIEDFLTREEYECRIIAGMIREFIGYRDAGVPLTTLRSELRRLSNAALVTPQEREKRLYIGFSLLDNI